MSTPIFCTSYFPSIEYLHCCTQFQQIEIEQWEQYPKQTVRNRCFILSPNGVQCLTVPVKHKSGSKTLIKDIKISYDEKWQQQHWRSLEAAYNRSAFFEFYKDDLSIVFLKQHEFLIDLNDDIFHWMMKKFKHSITIKRTESFNLNSSFQNLSNRKNNFLSLTSPKAKPYPQVFTNKFGFVENLSGLDWLFNTAGN